MKLLLISRTAIIVKIFTLICKKLDIELTVQMDNNVDQQMDIIVIDNEYIDERFNALKPFTKKLGAIVAEELPFDKSRDFIIPRPFLPAQLQEILQDQMNIIHTDAENAKKEAKRYNYSNTEDVVDYIDSLADDIAEDIENENDESVVTFASLKKGGILDRKELDKIQNLLNIEPTVNEIEMNDEDWLDLSEIIDKALDEVKDYEFDLKYDEPITLVLSKFNMDELKPLLLKLNQNSIDKLTSGGSINLELKLKDSY
ncbi:MAG: hypothetical protein ACNI3C_00965 [Candidatus Marinarcus sp.]|uniref:hypothetical protein n=1 Tax=Candidatus Marinarcus sp. TaxID=3100987 RepID=UPI003B007AF0